MLVPIATSLAWPLPPSPTGSKELGVEYHLHEGRLNPREEHNPNSGHSPCWMASPKQSDMDRVTICFNGSGAVLAYACYDMVIISSPFHSQNIPVGIISYMTVIDMCNPPTRAQGPKSEWQERKLRRRDVWAPSLGCLLWML